MDFFEFTAGNQWRLSKGDSALFDYVVRNIATVKTMSIRELAGACFVSTTTVFRFVKKLGFAGYSDFIACLRDTDARSPAPQIPDRMLRADYHENYLKNIIETVRVIDSAKADRFCAILRARPRIYLLANGLSAEVARYVHYLLAALGFDATVQVEPLELGTLSQRVTDDDLLLVLSHSGENRAVLDAMERVLATARPTIVTVTNSENNSVFALGDLDIYVFSDAATFAGFDITSRISMIAAIEYLLNYYLQTGRGLRAEG